LRYSIFVLSEHSYIGYRQKYSNILVVLVFIVISEYKISIFSKVFVDTIEM